MFVLLHLLTPKLNKFYLLSNYQHYQIYLNNIFDLYVNEAGRNEVELKGSSKIIPDVWSYHVLSYDCETGILEYLVNGVTEDLIYITSNNSMIMTISII